MPDGAGAGLPTRADFRFFRPHQVRYVELDTQGIVFNAHYLTWYDEAVSDYIRAAGWNYQAEVKASGADFHVVRGLVEYKVAIGRAARIEVAARTTRIGRSSITFLPAVFPQGEDTLLQVHGGGVRGFVSSQRLSSFLMVRRQAGWTQAPSPGEGDLASRMGLKWCRRWDLNPH